VVVPVDMCPSSMFIEQEKIMIGVVCKDLRFGFLSYSLGLH
jgi:hypothetical protein